MTSSVVVTGRLKVKSAPKRGGLKTLIRLQPDGQSLKCGQAEHFQNGWEDTWKTKGKISKTLETRSRDSKLMPAIAVLLFG